MRLDPQPRLRVNSTRRIRRSAANPGQLVPLPASIVERLREHSQRQLAEKLWVERPRLKVIFTSGYSAEVVGADFVLRRGINYLQKPYAPRKLALAVRECLDAVN